jgi:ABC-type Fe3+/spermidine/putrescine transport system ATPase subunit
LFPHLNVEKNISYALLHKRHSKVDIRARVFKWAEITNIVHLLDRMPDRLSGGEARRVALARTLAMQPGLLLLDEPLSSLDALLQFEMMKLLKEINNAGLTVIHVTHEPAEAWALAGFLAIMNNGRIEQTGTPTQVFGRPESRFVAALAGTRNFFPVLQSVTENTLTKITTTNGMLLISTELLHTGQSCFINEFDIQIGLTDETAGKNIFTGTIMERIPAQNYATLVIDTGLVFCVRVSSNDDKDCMLQPGSTVSLKIPESAIKASGNHATIS